MGGDLAPKAPLGALDALVRAGVQAHFKVFGDMTAIERIIKDYPHASSACEFVHCSKVISGSDKPSFALRRSQDSSMYRAIECVKNKEADCVVSSGNTGALMAISVVLLRTVPGVKRPAIATVMPNKKDGVVVLDLGATIESDPETLANFAVMGSVFAKILKNKSDPLIGLINVGSEEGKGHANLHEAAKLIKAQGLNFHGYVEGDDIAKGTVDVVVTDGFTGNVVLKALEGYASMFKTSVVEELRRSFLAKLACFAAIPVLRKLARRFDPKQYNGALLLGVNGIVVKSHGSSDESAIATALRTACSLVERKINDAIAQNL